ncbi:phage tail tip fiber protein, partial [Vibrio parahaemolyticus]
TAVSDAKFTESRQALADAEQALVEQITQLESTFSTDLSTTNANITSLEQTVADNDSAMSQRVDSVESAYKSADSSLSSSISSLSQTVTTNKNSITTRVNNVESAYKSADNSLSGRITSLQTTVANEDEALSDRIDSTNATINGVSATVTSHSQAIASINKDGSDAYQAMWSLKASAGQVSAGIGLLAGSGGVSQVVVSASQFFVFNPNSPTTKTPLFAIDAGKVIIPEALIEKATIQILNAQTITADYVKSGISISSPVINGGSLTGSVLKVGAGGPYSGHHFYVNSSGTAYLNNATVKGTIVATGGSFSNVVINENCTIRGTLDGADGTFSGTVYAENIVGDIASMREYAYNYRNSTADVNANTWLNVITVNIDSARPYARKLTIEPVSSGSIFVNMYAAHSGWYNCTYRLVGPTGTVHATYTSKYQISSGVPLYNITPSVGRVFAEIAANAPAGAYRLQFSCDRDAEYIFVDYNDAWRERRNHILLANLFKDSGELS